MDGGTRVFPYFRCDLSRNIHLGRYVTINFDRVFMNFTGVTIRDVIMIDSRSVLATLGHTFPPEERRFVATRALPITFEDDVWLGAGMIVLPGVIIGDGVVVGSGAVVTHDIPPGGTWVGVPARRLER